MNYVFQPAPIVSVPVVAQVEPIDNERAPVLGELKTRHSQA